MAEVAIIGGGIAGSSVALYLSQIKELNITLFEKEQSLVSGPPMCHLHAGGNLYREIDDDQCVTLLKQSIELVRLYPYAIDFRPTVLITPLDDPQKPEDMLQRLQLLRDTYAKMVAEDSANEVLGKSKHYFTLFERKEVEDLAHKEIVQNPQTPQEWMIPVAKHVDLSRVAFPIIMVQEYGLNMFRISVSVTTLLRDTPNVTLNLSTPIHAIERAKEGYNINGKKYDYLINAAGFRSGEIDDILGYHRERLVEFKAAYVRQCHAMRGDGRRLFFTDKGAHRVGWRSLHPIQADIFSFMG